MSNLRPAVATSAVTPTSPDDSERLHPVLWPLAAYLAVGTLVLFLVSQLDALGAYVAPWSAEKNRWHEGSGTWMALFPLTTPFLVLYGIQRLGIAIPARVLERFGRLLVHIGRYIQKAWAAVRAAIARARAAVQRALHDAMTAVRRTAEVTVRRVRASLARLTSRT